MASIIDIAGLTKRYASGFEALKGVDLSIAAGEIFALLGPNGAGKTTMISIVCGIARPTSGTVRVAGHDILRDYRGARSAIGLVPQELSTDQFERVIDTVTFSRGLFGKPRNDDAIYNGAVDNASGCAGLLALAKAAASLQERRRRFAFTVPLAAPRSLAVAAAVAHAQAVLVGVEVRLTPKREGELHR